ncbi:DinB family protein [Pedobacter sp. JCM 36344]|uniref:DinB family protein n=1 Tax=Pedobacter sp. JCM 36344 TaxID=3374280 RepID=UPI003978404F
MKDFFKDLFEYNHHCNQQLGSIFKESPGKTSEKSIKVYCHILNAQRIWNNRIDPGRSTSSVWEIHPMQDLKNIDLMNYKHSLLIIDNFDLNDTISYANTKGQTFSNSLKDMLFHAINHSTYHRAQIATEFKQNGLEPLATDYIFYKR